VDIAISGALTPLVDELSTTLRALGHTVGALDERSDQLDAVVRVAGSLEQLTSVPLAELSADDWQARTSQPLHAALAFHQAAARHFVDRASADRRGRIVVVVPTVALTGGAGVVPLATTADAERSLVKSQARALGPYGLTVNCIAVDSALLAGRSLDRAGLQARPLPVPTVADLAATIDGLLSPAFDAVTGQTIAVDGGRWSAP
jgi:NAD(P)-dependent dehydrogenase (short-subunit alcohol dehydrogenase family)